jgi:hypothetical protein
MVKKIKFTIDEQGEVSVSVEGATGSECEKLTAPFEALLGPVTVRQLKDSYYETNQDETSIDVGKSHEGFGQ